MPPGTGLDAVRLDRRLRPFGPRWNVPLAARLATGLRGGFQWDREDSDTKDWYPQGIDGRGRYCSSPGTRSTTAPRALSVVDTDAGRYGHVALVGSGGKPVKTHAGGLAWREHMLYVADTKGGLRLFDLRCFAGDTLPQAGRYRAGRRGAAVLLLLGRRGERLAAWSASTSTSCRARGSCAGRSRRGGLLAQEPASDAWATAHAEPPGRGGARRPGADGVQQRADAPGAALTASPFAETGRAQALGDRRRGPRGRRRRGRVAHRAPRTCRGRWRAVGSVFRAAGPAA